MECLREQTVAGRRGTVPCPTEGCLHRRFSIDSNSFIAEEASKTDCVLQLRLRAGDSSDAGYPHIIRGMVFNSELDEYVEREFVLTDAQYDLVRGNAGRFSLAEDGAINLINFEE